MTKSKDQPLISIVTPVFNAEKYLAETIKSVLEQTYTNWELLLIDDGSKDDSLKIARKFANSDKRIKVYSIENSGAAVARNTGIEKAKGQYICFIDADDLWYREKLAKQLEFMQADNCSFSFTGYEFANEEGEPNGKVVNVPETITYKQALKNTTIWTSTVMLNMHNLSKEDIYMPLVKRGQDTATWWKILKKIACANGLNEVLSIYRRPNNSLSSNKIKALKRTWNLYRKIENFNVFKSSYYFTFYCINAIKRRF